MSPATIGDNFCDSLDLTGLINTLWPFHERNSWEKTFVDPYKLPSYIKDPSFFQGVIFVSALTGLGSLFDGRRAGEWRVCSFFQPLIMERCWVRGIFYINLVYVPKFLVAFKFSPTWQLLTKKPFWG